MQMETNAAAVATLATHQSLSAEVKYIQMLPGLCLGPCTLFLFNMLKYSNVVYLHAQQKKQKTTLKQTKKQKPRLDLTKCYFICSRLLKLSFIVI